MKQYPSPTARLFGFGRLSEAVSAKFSGRVFQSLCFLSLWGQKQTDLLTSLAGFFTFLGGINSFEHSRGGWKWGYNSTHAGKIGYLQISTSWCCLLEQFLYPHWRVKTHLSFSANNSTHRFILPFACLEFAHLRSCSVSVSLRFDSKSSLTQALSFCFSPWKCISSTTFVPLFKGWIYFGMLQFWGEMGFYLDFLLHYLENHVIPSKRVAESSHDFTFKEEWV